MGLLCPVHPLLRRLPVENRLHVKSFSFDRRNQLRSQSDRPIIGRSQKIQDQDIEKPVFDNQHLHHLLHQYRLTDPLRESRVRRLLLRQSHLSLAS